MPELPEERDVQALARKIAAVGESETSRVFNLSWLSDRLLDWAMAHPAFKTQLFRFVDVFPACRDDADVLRHLEEYLGGHDSPRVLGLGLGVAEHVPLGGHVSALAARRNIMRMARQFIAGASAEEALPRLGRLWAAGEACSVDLLGERTITREEAERYAGRVGAMLEACARASAGWPSRPLLEQDPWGRIPRINISVKPSALSPLFHPATSEEGLAEVEMRLRPILERAAVLPATIHLDMEHDATKELTIELLYRLGRAHPSGPPLGIVVQAYRRDAYADLLAIVEWARATLATPLLVRLVKGAYWDAECALAQAHGWPVPVFTRKAETDANYERCVRALLASAGVVRPAFGSHNLRSLAYAVVAARQQGLAPAGIELQLLYGMAEPIHAALRRLGFRVRVYAPIGQLVPGMAYLVRRLLENTSNESFIRHRFAEGQALESLVGAPDVAEDALPPPAAIDTRAGTDPANPSPFANEPPVELHRAAARTWLTTAITRQSATLGFSVPAVVAGRRIETDEAFESVDPGETATVVCRSARTTAREGEAAVGAVEAAQVAWQGTAWDERAAVLFRAAALMRARRSALAALVVFEAGKPPLEADAEVCEAIDFCEYYGRAAHGLAVGAPVLDVPGERNRHEFRARGVGAVIAPWNFPLAIPAGMVTAALVTGNGVLFKPAEQTPGVGLRLVEILIEAGVPPGVLAFLPGVGEEIGAWLVDHPAMSFIAFTGSRAVGLSIIERAARRDARRRCVVRVIAEMGGKNPVVVDSDADLDEAVPAIVASAFSYAGQKCSAASRVIVVRSVFDEFVDRLVGATRLVPVGHQRAFATTCGPLIDADAHQRVARYQAWAREEGEVVLQRTDVPAGGWYAGPTLVVLPDQAGKVARDEIFGPVLAVIPAQDLDDALRCANETDYALTAGVFSRSPAGIARARAGLRAGNVYVNRAITGAMVGRQPFGGSGLSGVGSKAGGAGYLRQFVDPYATTENTMRQGFTPLGE